MAVPPGPAALRALADSLPPRLLNYFRKFPPGSVTQTPPPSATVEVPSGPGSSTTRSQTILLTGQRPTEKHVHPALDPSYNPFLPWLNPITGRWRPALYSLRKQADLVKMAQSCGVESLLPWTSKLSWVREEKRVKHGLRVKGTGVGERVRGKGWERKIKGTLQQRREAMRRMPELVKSWKELGHGRGWKKWPK